jgi:hypothetical protein
MRLLSLVVLFGLASCGGTSDTAPPLEAGITVSGHFGPEGSVSEDVSGLACDWQRGGGTMRCLAIEDEGDAAQWTTFDGAILAAGPRFGLLGMGEPLGTPPRDLCSQADPDNRELDGEAAAFDAGIFYVTGSHGCSRNSDELRPAGFTVARIEPDDPAGEIVPGTVAIATSHRLTGMLRRDPALARFFGASLRAGNGLNIEGLAARGDRMVFGLRAPVVDGTGYLFETSATALFSRAISGGGRAIPVALGEHAGIRDLAFLPDGRLLILSGPAQEQDVPYRVHLRGADGAARVLATVEAPRGGKAEAMAVTGIDGDAVSLLILFDGVDDGAPQRLELAVPAAP